MRWIDVSTTSTGRAIRQCLSERPFLQALELRDRLARLDINLTIEELEGILWDENSPFFHEPLRWTCEDESTEHEGDWIDPMEEMEILETAPPISIDPEEVGPQITKPTRWIGPPLRKWQREAFESWIANGEHGIVEAITGTGKTLVGIYAAAYVLDYGYKVAITVPTLDLMDQWIEQLERYIIGVEVGKITSTDKTSSEDVDVRVSTIISGSKWRLHDESSPTLLISDEVHRMGSKSYSKALEPDMEARMGLTATLERTNDDGVDEELLPYFNSVVYTYGYADGLKDGVLAPFRLGFLATEFTDSEAVEFKELGTEMARLSNKLKESGLLHSSGNEVFAEIGALSKNSEIDFKAMRWAQKFMSNLSARKRLQSTAVNKLVAIELLAPSMSTAASALVFTETKESSAQIAEILQADGIHALPFDSDLHRDERVKRLRDFRDRKIQVLCAPRVLDEGIDVSGVDVGVIVSASQSRRQMIQRLGRIVRPNENGAPSTLFLMYLKGTREDPELGGHEGFLSEVLPHAQEIAYFDLNSDPNQIAEWHKDY